MVKAVFFDFMGTCLDWHSGVISILPQHIPEEVRSNFALEWRQMYFDSNNARLNQAPEDIDVTLRNTLLALLEKHQYQFDDALITKCITQWHNMPAWPEVPAAISQIRKSGLETFVFANGTTRLQLDLCRSSGLSFDMLFSSALLGVYKPALASYQKTLELTKLNAEDTVQVAAHITDLRGAKAAGMKTIYIRRWTDDIREDMDLIRKEVDYFLEDMTGLPELIAKL